jgi:hypothetical protein
MNTIPTVSEIMNAARESGYGTTETINANPQSGTHKTHKTPDVYANMSADDLYAAGARCGKRMVKQTDFIRSGKQHATKDRGELLAACRATLAEMTTISREISPRNPNGYADPNDPFAIDCLIVLRREIDLLEQGHNTTPL